ncbi:MAG: hypothetical protein PHS37_07775, partial [Candidatus Omnitrophica bacterium]|nr:hypothetical protein [Candidatus Omnitrophota bacterium]
MKTAWLVLVAVLLIVGGEGASCYGQESIGIVTSLEGVADISHGAGDAVFLKENDAVSLNDRIRTKNYSKLEITFLDKSV